MVVAVAVHGMWNMLVGLAAERNAEIYMTLAYGLLTILTMGIIAILYLALQLESQMLKRELATEIAGGFITSSEVNMVADPVGRRSRKWLPRGAMRTHCQNAPA